MFKQTGKISDHIGILKMASDARMLIGHCRFATDGDPRYNINNHPHAVDGGWFVHNGIIGQNYARLVEDRDLHCISRCDSEVIGRLVEETEGAMLERLIDACHVATNNALVVLGLWKNPDQLLAVRSRNPLYLGETKNGYYFASLRDSLPDPFMVRDNSALKFSADKSGYFYEMTAFDASPASAT